MNIAYLFIHKFEHEKLQQLFLPQKLIWSRRSVPVVFDFLSYRVLFRTYGTKWVCMFYVITCMDVSNFNVCVEQKCSACKFEISHSYILILTLSDWNYFMSRTLNRTSTFFVWWKIYDMAFYETKEKCIFQTMNQCDQRSGFISFMYRLETKNI